MMRWRMLRELVGNAIRSKSLTALRVLRCYRQLRETISNEALDGFEHTLIGRTAIATGVTSETVSVILAEWMEERPLAHIRLCRYPYVTNLFSGLMRRGKAIGVLSDYPAVEKLRAMELTAHFVVSASDSNVGMLKPHPRGLQVLMDAAGVGPTETVLIGDRIEKDGEAARRAGASALIRTDKPHKGWLGFSRFSDPLFAPLLD